MSDPPAAGRSRIGPRHLLSRMALICAYLGACVAFVLYTRPGPRILEKNPPQPLANR